MFPEVVVNLPEVLLIVLVATRVFTNTAPVEIEPPVLLMAAFDAVKLATLSALKSPVTFKYEIRKLWLVKFVAFTVWA